MRFLIILFTLFLNLTAQAVTINFKLLNDGAQDTSTDSVVNLGYMTSTALCNDPGLIPLSQLKETTISNASANCANYSTGGNRGVDLSIPVTAKILTTQPLAVQFSKYTEGPDTDFQIFILKVGRTGSFAGGSPSFDNTFTMNNNDEWDFQLDIRAIITGPQAKNRYVNGISITITPI